MMSALSSGDPQHPPTATFVKPLGQTPWCHSLIEGEGERAVDKAALPRRGVAASSSAPAARSESRAAQAHHQTDRSSHTRRCAAAPCTAQATRTPAHTNRRAEQGLSYQLQYVGKPGKFDEVVGQDGVKVLIDSKALFSIIGSEMD
ncbi:uncharacterized protein B0H18DRAFT_1175940 [Fomitopsis serialis]|uniref:uncharacterized protein n=1 Tax=Fomitopsis serialis TaxID=139415 RepID=UPI002007A668|nr:uncharacterized protein B0H18DRAFT_1175940 [Neoantrodia serialis]KAH9924462.1 hypothetical protein B0H18DRAFT_1175940 [Neoantrodia serialis]